jgi:hypothetical protein
LSYGAAFLLTYCVLGGHGLETRNV